MYPDWFSTVYAGKILHKSVGFIFYAAFCSPLVLWELWWSPRLSPFLSINAVHWTLPRFPLLATHPGNSLTTVRPDNVRAHRISFVSCLSEISVVCCLMSHMLITIVSYILSFGGSFPFGLFQVGGQIWHLLLKSNHLFLYEDLLFDKHSMLCFIYPPLTSLLQCLISYNLQF